jgi:hypothetical protein
MTEGDPQPGASDEPAEPASTPDSARPAGRTAGRPIVERIGMAAIAALFAVLFGGVALAAFDGGEPFLGVMAAIGCLMTIWVGAITLFRG